MLSNVEDFQRLKNQGGYFTRTVIRITVTDENGEAMPKILEFWRRRVDSVSAVEEIPVPSSSLLLERGYACGKPVECDKPFKHLTVIDRSQKHTL